MNSVSLEVFLGKNFQSRLNIYKLWYEVYCLEMGRDLKKADHDRLILKDDLEPFSVILVAKLNNAVIGTLRITSLSEKKKIIEYYKSFYELHSDDCRLGSIVTKFVVHSKYRNMGISKKLMKYAIDFLKKRGNKQFFIDCSPRVYKLFDKLGFVQCAEEKMCPNYGVVKIMKYELI